MTIDTDQIWAFFQSFGWLQWLIVVAAVAMFFRLDERVGPLTDKLLAWFRGSNKPDEIPPVYVDELPSLIHQIRLCVCDDPPSVRDGINRHLDEIEQLLSTTEVDAE